MRYAVLGGGKRLRGFLVMEGSGLFGVSDACSARVASAVEMVHAYSLVHDDLPAMDNDDWRRGKPSAHRAFDEATAILAGDALQARAFEVLAEPATHEDAAVRSALVASLAGAVGPRGMAGGQMLDMVAGDGVAGSGVAGSGVAGDGVAGDAAAVTRLQVLKTGRLIEFSAEAGAILGRAPRAERDSLAAYGRDLGAAFQIADDLLDAEGDAAAMGKAAGKDAAAGKATLVGVWGAARAREHAWALARQAAGRLDGFGAGAQALRELAFYAVERRS